MIVKRFCLLGEFNRRQLEGVSVSVPVSVEEQDSLNGDRGVGRFAYANFVGDLFDVASKAIAGT
jgi:hypothetical protein